MENQNPWKFNLSLIRPQAHHNSHQSTSRWYWTGAAFVGTDYQQNQESLVSAKLETGILINVRDQLNTGIFQSAENIQ